MNRLAAITSDSDVVVINSILSAFPPERAAPVPSWWSGTNGVVPAIVVDVSADGATAPTDMLLHGAILKSGTIADLAFTRSSGNILTANGHGRVTGDGPVRLTTSGVLPAGLELERDYWFAYLGTNTFSFAVSLEDAFSGTVVTLTDAGTGTHTLVDTDDTKLVQWRDLGLLASAPTITSRRGFMFEATHDPRVVAYGVTWTGGSVNAIRVAVSPRVAK